MQRVFVWILLGLFGATALVGQGLHFLPGLAHPSGVSAHLGQSCQGHDAACHRPASSGDQRPGLIGVHDCPICRYFALVKRVPGEARVDRDGTVLAGPPVPAVLPVSRRAIRAYDPRGPPRDVGIA